MVENEYEIETEHYAIICARQREKDKVEAMRYDTMCKQTTYSQYFSSLLLLRNRITFFYLIQTSTITYAPFPA